MDVCLEYESGCARSHTASLAVPVTAPFRCSPAACRPAALLPLHNPAPELPSRSFPAGCSTGKVAPCALAVTKDAALASRLPLWQRSRSDVYVCPPRIQLAAREVSDGRAALQLSVTSLLAWPAMLHAAPLTFQPGFSLDTDLAEAAGTLPLTVRPSLHAAVHC